ncbi:hypothetical protein H8S23_08800 [Anaerofilum sp. BX8]|uniref:Uncharacterized protein n=1 Tax=Anaerofilum hominis TaxID=2763016 RepID=A0A923L1K6_9FIRM|nr:hypothetical protein [Anaerofilum hominis]MBC5581603.1 hypothetical protein [Anaerofilum hominis]
MPKQPRSCFLLMRNKKYVVSIRRSLRTGYMTIKKQLIFMACPSPPLHGSRAPG